MPFTRTAVRAGRTFVKAYSPHLYSQNHPGSELSAFGSELRRSSEPNKVLDYQPKSLLSKTWHLPCQSANWLTYGFISNYR